MIKRLLLTIKKHAVKLAISLVLGALIGSVATYLIEEQKVTFWKERFIEANELNKSMEQEYNSIKQKNKELAKKNKELKKDLSITILSNVRSNFYNLKAIKSENYNKQMYYNNEEYKSNLIPIAMSRKWDINIMDARNNANLNHIIDSVYQSKTEK